MKIFYVLLVLVISLTAACQNDGKKIKWKKLKNEEEARLEVTKRLPANVTVADVNKFLTEQKMEHSELTDSVIYAASGPWSASFFIEQEWFLEFYFDGNGKLDSLVTKNCFTGP